MAQWSAAVTLSDAVNLHPVVLLEVGWVTIRLQQRTLPIMHLTPYNSTKPKNLQTKNI